MRGRKKGCHMHQSKMRTKEVRPTGSQLRRPQLSARHKPPPRKERPKLHSNINTGKGQRKKGETGQQANLCEGGPWADKTV